MKGRKLIMKVIRITFIAVFLLSAISTQASTQYQLNRLGFLPGDGYGNALHINNAGEVLGNSRLLGIGLNDSRGAFLWNHTSGMVDIRIEDQFDSPGDINNSGQVAGIANPGYGPTTAILREADGKLMQLKPIRDGAYGTAYGINDKGWVVGCSDNLAVLWQGSVNAQTIGNTSCSNSCAIDINNNDSIAWNGNLYDSNNQFVGRRSYVWNNGVNTLLQGINADDNCYACAINDSGYVIGNSGDNAVVWNSDGKIILNLGNVEVSGINNSGQIVGVKDDRAVIWNPDGSICADLGMLGGVYTHSIAYGINDSGQVVGGIAYDEYNNLEPALWQPVPEPSSILALLCGLGSLSAFKILKRK